MIKCLTVRAQRLIGGCNNVVSWVCSDQRWSDFQICTKSHAIETSKVSERVFFFFIQTAYITSNVPV